MVLHNPNNWHWVNKDVKQWAQEYLEKNLVGLKAEEGNISAEITRIMTMEGDVDVSQRKGKVITLFDVKLDLEWEGNSKRDDKTEEAKGKISIPEVAHDTEENEYVFELDVYDETLAKQPVKDLVRTKLTPQLRKNLAQLGPTLIDEHGKDLQHATGQTPTLHATKVTSSSSVTQASNKSSHPPTTTTTASSGPSVNTVSITATDEFRTTAAELYETFTSPSRLAAFTRAPPALFEGAHPGGNFALFGGNVSGSYAELDSPKKIVQKWRLQTWPEGHESRLEIVFDQNNEDQVTMMRVKWDGVPVGEEEVVRRNWDEYYVRGIKRTFGFGTIL